jgi:hypothetical protein
MKILLTTLFSLTLLGCASVTKTAAIPPCKLVSNTDMGFILMPAELHDKKVAVCTQNIQAGVQCCTYVPEDTETDNVCIQYCQNTDGEHATQFFDCTTGEKLVNPVETL